MAGDALVQVHRDAVAVVTLNRPQALHAFDWRMRAVLTEALTVLDADASVGAIVLTASGDRAFSAGQDLQEAVGYGVDDIPAWMRHQQAMYQAVRACAKPLVAAFNGLAAGSGFHLGLMADFRVGHDEVVMGQPEVRMGLASIVGPFLMAPHLPQSWITGLTLGARMLSAAQAEALGLLDRRVPREDVTPAALALARELAGHPAQAVSLTKAWRVRETQAGFERAFDEVIRCHQAEYATGVPQARMRAFLEARRRRSPLEPPRDRSA